MIQRFSIASKIGLSVLVFVLGASIAIGVAQVQALLGESQLYTTSVGLFPAARASQQADAAFQRMAKPW